MLDAAFVRQHLEEVKANCRNRNVRVDVDGVAAAYDRRRQLIQQQQTVQQRANEVSKLIPKEKDPTRKQELIAEGRTLREQAATLEKQVKDAETELEALLKIIPNLSHPAAPVGTTAEDNKVLRRWGEPTKF